VIRAIVVGLVLTCVSLAAAETRRVAVIVGNNVGNQDQQALRYAEVDAGKLARVLVELGGVASEDLYLLQGRDLKSLDDTLRRAKAKIADYRKHLDRVIVIFYYSGHSDGVALELGRDRYTFAALRDWLKDTGAEVRLALVDSCKSGALLATKGGALGPAFHIRLTDELSSTGEALLTSSAADENALESKEIGGSFFTHHLVSGLRGAADSSGDGRVTLTEAYQYAYKHTITTSGATLAGPQHPTYDYRLSGQGELVLTELARPSAALALPDGFDRALVVDAAREQVIVELGRGEPARIALVPGRYIVRAWRDGKTFEHAFAIAANEQRAVTWAELMATTAVVSRPKGDVAASFEPSESASAVSILVAGGTRVGIADGLGALGVVRVGVRPRAPRGPTLSLDVGTRSAGALRESTAFLFAGYRVGWDAGPLRASAGLELGGGLVRQAFSGETGSTGAVALAPTAGVAIAVTPSIAFTLEGQLPATLVKADDKLRVVALPGAWLGVVVTP
jgi:caspase domain-containing protein